VKDSGLLCPELPVVLAVVVILWVWAPALAIATCLPAASPRKKLI